MEKSFPNNAIMSNEYFRLCNWGFNRFFYYVSWRGELVPDQGYVLGIDAGGTSTRCWAVSTDGRLLGAAKGGPGNLYTVGLAGLVQRMQEVAAGAAGHLQGPAEALCLGAAGVGRAHEVAEVQAALAELHLARKLAVRNDGIISLAAGTLGGPGVGVIAGTGSIAVGLSAAGEQARAGGWGYMLGDEGSGYDIAHKALIAVLRGHDGRQPATALQPILLDALQLQAPEDLVDLFYRKGIAKDQVAALAPLVLSVAEHDQAAAAIVTDAADELVRLVVAVHNRLTLEADAPVVVSGGMFKNALLSRLFTQSLGQTLPAAKVVAPPWEAALGAVFLALRLAGASFTWQNAHDLAAQIDARKG